MSSKVIVICAVTGTSPVPPQSVELVERLGGEVAKPGEARKQLGLPS